MIAAAALFAYAIVVACCASPLLARLTGRGASARFGLAGWLTAMVSAGLSGLLGAYLVMAKAVADWVPLSQAVCRSVAGSACSPPVYRSMLYEAGVTALAIIVMIAGLAAACAVPDRVERLLNPPGPAAIAASRLTLATVSAALILLPAALTMISA